MVSTAAKIYTRNELRAAIIDRFGEDTTFYTCSATGMSPDAMIDFLKARGKFIEAGDGGYAFNENGSCGHHH